RSVTRKFLPAEGKREDLAPPADTGLAPPGRARRPGCTARYRAGVYRFLATPRWLGFAALMLLLAVTLVGPGDWQVPRYRRRGDPPPCRPPSSTPTSRSTARHRPRTGASRRYRPITRTPGRMPGTWCSGGLSPPSRRSGTPAWLAGRPTHETTRSSRYRCELG